jgi:hypothetical protein
VSDRFDCLGQFFLIGSDFCFLWGDIWQSEIFLVVTTVCVCVCVCEREREGGEVEGVGGKQQVKMRDVTKHLAIQGQHTHAQQRNIHPQMSIVSESIINQLFHSRTCQCLYWEE